MSIQKYSCEDNKEFELRGINHLALVCRDMERTVDFYTNVLGMPLTKTIDLPGGMGQHFFFDIGNGDALAFFWFPEAGDAAPGVAAPEALVGRGSATFFHGSMNHVAFDVAPEKIEEYRAKLEAQGVDVTPIFNHDTSPAQISDTVTDDVFVRSIYFFDPDGVMLEFAAWTRDLRPDEVEHTPATEGDRERYLETQENVRRAIAKMRQKRES